MGMNIAPVKKSQATTPISTVAAPRLAMQQLNNQLMAVGQTFTAAYPIAKKTSTNESIDPFLASRQSDKQEPTAMGPIVTEVSLPSADVPTPIVAATDQTSKTVDPENAAGTTLTAPPASLTADDEISPILTVVAPVPVMQQIGNQLQTDGQTYTAASLITAAEKTSAMEYIDPSFASEQFNKDKLIAVGPIITKASQSLAGVPTLTAADADQTSMIVEPENATDMMLLAPIASPTAGEEILPTTTVAVPLLVNQQLDNQTFTADKTFTAASPIATAKKASAMECIVHSVALQQSDKKKPIAVGQIIIQASSPWAGMPTQIAAATDQTSRTVAPENAAAVEEKNLLGLGKLFVPKAINTSNG